MITDAELRIEGLKALTGALGDVQAERFIASIMRQPFDYTRWQQTPSGATRGCATSVARP